MFLLLSFAAFSQQARIQKHFPKFEDKIDAALFTCHEKNRAQGTGVSEVELLDNNTLQIINHTPAPALGGVSITILLDTNLKVLSIQYKEWGDLMGAYKRTFTVESPLVLLNFNPFKKGTERLQGRYHFIIKCDYEPGEMLAREGEKPSTDYRIFSGRFFCEE